MPDQQGLVMRRATVSTALVAALAVGVAMGCEDAPAASPDDIAQTVPWTAPGGRRLPISPEADPGPRRWAVKGGGSQLESTGARAGRRAERSARRRERAKQLTKAEIRARLAGIRNASTEGSPCEQAFAALGEANAGLRELLEANTGGGPSRADYLELCRAFPRDVQECLGPAAHVADDHCDAVLQRFASNRDDPAWLERLTGHPASDRPPPDMTEEEARALNRGRRR